MRSPRVSLGAQIAKFQTAQFSPSYTSSPSISDVKNAWSYTFTPQYAFMGCRGTTLFLLYILNSNTLLSRLFSVAANL